MAAGATPSDISINLKANDQGLAAALQAAATQVSQFARQSTSATPAVRSLDAALRSVNTQVRAANSVFRSAPAPVKALGAALKNVSALSLNLGTVLLPMAVAGFGARLLQTADQYGQLAAKIKLTTASAEEAVRVQQQLYAQSQETGTSYAANVDAYGKLALSLREVGVSSQTTVNLVDLVNKSLAVNGSTAEMAASFQQQFAQALASGVLQGDEFQDMLESNGYFAGQLAQALDTDIAGLSKMSSEGKLTTDLLLATFAKMSDQISQDYAKIPATASNAVQMIRNTWDQVVSGANTAASGTSRVATALQDFATVIDKNSGTFSVFVSRVIDLTAKTVELTTRFGQFVVKNGEMVQVIGTVTVSALALGRAFVFLSTLPAQVLAAHAAMTAFATSTAASVAAAGSAAWIGLGMAVGFTAIKITEAVQAYKSWQAAEAEHQASLARGKQYETELQARLEKISQQTGITVKSFAELRQAVDEGRLHYDSATKTWVAGAQKQTAAVEGVKKATGDALKEMQKQYQEYAKEIRRLQDEISGRQRSLAAELREMGRTGMSDAAAWQDQKREAEEYVQAARRAAQEAKAAFASGDTITAAARWREAVQYADDARSAYRQLNTEVKEGDQVVVSKADALKTAMDGVKQAGELGVSILKEQQEVAAKAMDELVGQSGFADLTEGMSKAEKLWLESWRNMQTSAEQAVEEVSFKISAQQVQIESIEQAWLRSWANNRNYFVQVTDELRRRLDEATRPRTVTVYTAEVVRRATGGLINAFARGGRLPGYGGGDKVSALLEAGEFVIRKEAVKRYGAGFFAALNSLRLPDLSGLVPTLPSPALAGAGTASPTRTVNINLNVGGETYQMQTDERTAARLERWYALRSSNRLTRADFRG